jgi:hypothetical protein
MDHVFGTDNMARIAGVSRATVSRAIKSGQLKASWQEGGTDIFGDHRPCWGVESDELERWAKERKASDEPPEEPEPEPSPTAMVGDIVHIRCEVISIGSGIANSHATLRPLHAIGPSPFQVLASSIVRVEPRPLRVGDRVRSASSGLTGTIAAIQEGAAWIRLDKPVGSYNHMTVHLPKLERLK